MDMKYQYTCNQFLDQYVRHEKNHMNNQNLYKFFRYNMNFDHIYRLHFRKMYENLYNMPKADLFWLIIDQFKIIKYHTILPLCDMTKHEMINVEIQNEEIMKQPNFKQKKIFKNNEDLMQLYTKNNKLNINTRRKCNNTRYINNN